MDHELVLHISVSYLQGNFLASILTSSVIDDGGIRASGGMRYRKCLHIVAGVGWRSRREADEEMALSILVGAHYNIVFGNPG